MARAKLGLSSSLAAARLLEAAERYGPPVPSAVDLGDATLPSQDAAAPDHRSGRPLIGAVLMILYATTLLLMLQSATPATHGRTIDEYGKPVPTREADMDEADAYLTWGFEEKDVDRSGFLDPREASGMEPRDAARDASLSPAPPKGRSDPAAARKWMDKLDHDRDGRVSRREYVDYMMPWILLQGVPADWRTWAKRPG